MALRERLYTTEEFFDYAALPENRDKRFELNNGTIVEIKSSSPIHTIVAGRIIWHLNAWVVPNDLGYVTGSDGGFKLASNRVRQPDVAYISKARLPQIPVRFDMPPDLVVEVVSENEDVFRKTREYLYAGVQLVWIVYADEQMVYVMNMHLDSSIRATPFGIGTTLNGGHVLPGFTLSVRDIFPE
jgi:Uma2 family endonuclease